MTESTTPRTALPLLAAAQAQKHVTHNEALLQLDALLFARLLDRDLSAPPSSPADGDTYLVHATATGAWTGKDGFLAFASDGAWRFYAPFTGLAAYVVDETRLIVYNGSAWLDYASILTLQNVPLLGVNTTADATNKLATKSAAILFDNVGNGVQAKLNKHAAGDTASLLYQTDYSGRAEIGLTGDDDFHFKVSPDGSAWSESIVVAGATGIATINQGLAAGAVPFGGATGGALAQDAAALAWSDSAKLLTLNGSGSTAPAVGATIGLHLVGSGTISRAILIDAVASTSQFTGRRANNSYAAPAALASGDQIMTFAGQGHDGAAWRNGGNFGFYADENWVTGTSSGSRMDVRLVANGTITTALTFSFFGDGRIQPTGAYVDLSYSYQTPATGFSITVANAAGRLLLDPAGTLATGTLTMPAAPKDGQVLRLASTRAITALTHAPNTGQTLNGALTTLAANGFAEYVYRAANTAWYRTG
ncbi:MAG TPA: DUF2793 domain-containing protein [Rhizomicrobium sp.]|jgi:hypothetical protein|nr:DUF2793 domain-containing protein [Rhizomicrobium sp.]